MPTEDTFYYDANLCSEIFSQGLIDCHALPHLLD